MGAGIGFGVTDIASTDNIASGSDRNYEFAWQVGDGLGYELTEYVTLTAGYRYFDLNFNEIELYMADDEDLFGYYSLDAQAHEFNLGMRVNFYTMPWPNWN